VTSHSIGSAQNATTTARNATSARWRTTERVLAGALVGRFLGDVAGVVAGSPTDVFTDVLIGAVTDVP